MLIHPGAPGQMVLPGHSFVNNRELGFWKIVPKGGYIRSGPVVLNLVLKVVVEAAYEGVSTVLARPRRS